MNKTAIALNIADIAAVLLVAYFIHPAVAIVIGAQVALDTYLFIQRLRTHKINE